jgi:hypothetical protein
MARIACLRASVQQLSKERSSSRRDGRRGEQRRDGVVMVYEEMKKPSSQSDERVSPKEKLPPTACVNLLGCEPPRYDQSEPGGESERSESCRAGGEGRRGWVGNVPCPSRPLFLVLVAAMAERGHRLKKMPRRCAYPLPQMTFLQA